MITLAEKFVATQIEKGSRTAFILAAETLLISLVGYFLITWDTFIIFLLRHPWIILFNDPHQYRSRKVDGPAAQ
ncbi:MAG: hypothetical protein WDN67_02210 [Candidatus Moraniibacteriota bacterium]